MINSCFKQYTFGQDKAHLPEDTIETVLGRLKQKGIHLLGPISRIDDLDRIGIPAYICQIDSGSGICDSAGKGITPEQAKAGAIMEAIERYSCEWFIKQKRPHIIAHYDSLREDALSPKDLLLPLPSTYQADEIIRDLEKAPVPWVESFSLTHNKSILFPLYWFYFIYGTTGFACGNTIEEGILQAIGEVIERHNISKVIQQKLFTPSVDIDSIDHDIAKSLIKKFLYAGIELYIKDFSLEFGIPTISVLAHDLNPPTDSVRVYNAAGAHLNRDFALIRALIELAQHRAQIILRKNKGESPGGPTYCFPHFKTIEDASYLTDNTRGISFNEIPTYNHPDFKVEIERAVNLIRDYGLEVIITNTTHPEIGIPSVIASIPGTRLNRPSTLLNPYYFMAKMYMDLGNYQHAVEYFEKSIDTDPNYKNIPQILCDLAVCYKELKMYGQAMPYFERTLELAPNLVMSKKFLREFTECLQSGSAG